MKNILFVEFWNISPHLETAFELAKRNLDEGNRVYFIFGGHDTLYDENFNFKLAPEVGKEYLPELRGAKLLDDKNFIFWNKFPILKSIKLADHEDIIINDVDDLLAFKYEAFDIGRFVYSSIMHRLGTAYVNIQQNWQLIEQYIKTGIALYTQSQGFMRYWQIDQLYIFNGRFCAQAAIVAAAHKENIKVLYHERGATKERYFLENFVPHDVAKVSEKMDQMWREAVEEDIELATQTSINYFQKMRNREELGWISFVKNQDKNFLPDFEKNKALITYFATNDDEYETLRDIFPWKYWSSQFHALDDLVQICMENRNVQLIIKLHPNLINKSSKDIAKWLSYEKSNVKIIRPEARVDTYALMEASDIVVTSGSTIGIEAAFWGRPVILMGPSFYGHLGACLQPKSRQELSRMIAKPQLQKHSNRALPFGYYYSVFGEVFKFYEPDTLFSGKFLSKNLLGND